MDSSLPPLLVWEFEEDSYFINQKHQESNAEDKPITVQFEIRVQIFNEQFTAKTQRTRR